MITIYNPEISIARDRCRISAKVDFPHKTESIWLETDNKYAAWLVADRCDGFLVGIIYWAMLHHQDITCMGPVTEQLLYQVQEYLAASLKLADDALHAPKIHAATIAPINNKSTPAVITGMSCGIDSFHVLSSQNETSPKQLRITHLLFNRVGAQGKDNHGEQQHEYRLENARRFADSQNLELLEVESNLHHIIPLKHEVHVTYRNAFVILCLQRMVSVYFYASEKSFAEFDLSRHFLCSGYYDLLSLSAFSLPGLSLYSEGAGLTRLQKIQSVVAYAPSQKHLNVCFWRYGTGANCTVHCEKCRGTLLSLESIGALELYKAVFDLKLYRQKQNMVLKEAIKQYARGNRAYYPVQVFRMLRRKKPVVSTLLYYYYFTLNLFRRARQGLLCWFPK
jgi:hypothetical protein